MHGYFSRDAGATLAKAMARAPAALLLGPRQCGKSTLARQLLAQRGDAVILDLQDRADRARLQEPELFFEAHRHQLVCLDEIQLLPEFFSLLRTELDLVLERGRLRRVYEIKLSKAPRVSRGFHELVGQLHPERAELIAPVDQAFEARPGIWVRPPLQASSAETV
jgi:predicted AAA+ superfamily ATPase